MITRDMELAVILGRLILILAVFTTTSFPVLYLFSPWYKARLGQAFMMQSCTLAIAIWLKFILTFFLKNGHPEFLLWANVVILVMITIATTSLTYLLWTIQSEARAERKELEHERLRYLDESAAE